MIRYIGVLLFVYLILYHVLKILNLVFDSDAPQLNTFTLYVFPLWPFNVFQWWSYIASIGRLSVLFNVFSPSIFRSTSQIQIHEIKIDPSSISTNKCDPLIHRYIDIDRAMKEKYRPQNAGVTAHASFFVMTMLLNRWERRNRTIDKFHGIRCSYSRLCDEWEIAGACFDKLQFRFGHGSIPMKIEKYSHNTFSRVVADDGPATLVAVQV